MKTIFVNLFAGPGAGKSTGAAYIFAKLKMAGINTEIVTEYAKDKVWEGATKVFGCQFYVSGKQAFRMFRVNGKVEVAVSDSPVALGAMYTDDDCLKASCVNEQKKYRNLNFFIERATPYSQAGRYQNEEEAIAIDNRLKRFLDDNGFPFTCAKGDQDGFDSIVTTIKNELAEHPAIEPWER